MAERSIILPFRGDQFLGLTNKYTLCEYDLSQYDGSGTLKDMKNGENFCAHSNDCSQTSAWLYVASSHNGFAPAPDGAKTASILNEGATNAEHNFQPKNVSLPTAGQYTFSVYLKAGGRSWAYIALWKAEATIPIAWFDLANGAKGTETACKASIYPLANGWFRCSIACTISNTGGWSPIIDACLANNGNVYQGANLDAIQIWGAQIERTDLYDRCAGTLIQTGANVAIFQDLTHNNNPSFELSPFMSANGRPLKSVRFNSNQQYFSKGHSALFDFAMNDFSIMVVGKKDNASANYDILAHSVSGASGWYTGWRSDNSILLYFPDASPVGAYSQGDAAKPNEWVVFHAVKRNGIAQVIVNGIPGVPVDAVGKGVAGSASFFMGRSSGNSPMPGNLLYARIDAGRLIGDDEIRAEQDKAFGRYGIRPNGKNVSYSFGRNLAAYQDNPDGTMTLVPTNVLRQASSGKWRNMFQRSQEFGNTAWTSQSGGCTVTENSFTAPDGSATADAIHEGTNNGEHYIAQTIPPVRAGRTYTFSCYAKASNRGWFEIYFYKDAVQSSGGYFNVSSGAVGTAYGNAKLSISAAPGTGWWRCTVTFTSLANTEGSLGILEVASADNTHVFQGVNQDSVIIWGAQFEEGTLTDYQPTKAGRARSAFLATPTATKNLIRCSTQFEKTTSNSSPGLWWPRGNDTITKNAATAPDGTQTMYGFIACTNDDAHLWQQVDRATSAFQGTFSVYAKAGAKNYAIVSSSSIAGGAAVFDLVNGTVTLQESGLTSAGCISVGGGIYRCWISYAQPSGGSTGCRFGSANGPTSYAYAGDGVSVENYFWGPQFEVGYVPTTYVPTDQNRYQLGDSAVDSGGLLVEDARTNLFTYSQDFSNSAWTKVNGWVAAESEIAPDITQTMDGLGPDATAGTHGVSQTLTPTAVPHVFSVFAKTRNYKPWVKLQNAGTANAYAYFNLLTGEVGAVGAGVTSYGAIPCANGVWRCWIMHTPTATASTFYIVCANGNNDDAWTGENYYVEQWYWGAQLEVGSHLTSYIPTAGASVQRPKDVLYMLPYRLNKMLQNQVSSNPMFSCGFEQEASGNIYSSGNQIKWSQNFENALWSKTRLSVSANVPRPLAPDGSASADILHEDGTASDTHYIGQANISLTLGGSYTASVYMKQLGKANREWGRIGIYDATNSAHPVNANFNLASGYVGTVGGSATVKSAKMENAGDGWWRCSITWTQPTANSTNALFQYYLVNGDNIVTFTGLDQDTLCVWGAQLELNVATNRTGPSHHVVTGGSIISQYPMAKNGYVKSRYTENEGFFHEFDGAIDYWTIANGSGGSNFNFAGSFSLVGAFTPLSVAAGDRIIAGKYNASGGWELYQSTDGLIFYANNGTSYTAITVATCLVVGQPVRFQVTYEYVGGAANNKMRLRVNGFTEASSDIAVLIGSNTAAVGIGALGDGSYKIIGRIHEFTAYNGYLANQTEHDNGYAAWKVEGILPTIISNTTAKKKLRVTFEAKCLYENFSEQGALNRVLCDIAGYGQNASSSKNRLVALFHDTGYFTVRFCDNAGNLHYGYTAVDAIKVSSWRTFSALIDLADLANMAVTVDGSASGFTYSGNSGTATLDLRENLIVAGAFSGYGDGPDAFIRNIALSAEE
jgi:hypothetical protein